MNPKTEFNTRYINLILDINKHIDGYIDAYIGPQTLQEEAANRPQRAAEQLSAEISQLREEIPTDDPARQAYLAAHLRAVETSIEILAGEEIPYMEEVQRIYDIMPQRIDEDLFMQAHEQLNTYLPGTGPLSERFESWRTQYNMPQDKLLPALRLVHQETKKRTKTLIDLPQEESVTLELVQDQPWSAYNWFKGSGRSLIEFNTDIPKSALALIPLFAHEGYPGHHTEAVLKEQEFWLRRGYGEASAMLLHSPAAVIAEGIAMTAVEIIFPDRDYLQWTLEELLPTIPMSANETADQILHLQEAMLQLRWVIGNAAILLHTGQLTPEQTVEYLVTYGNTSSDRARKSLQFITHPLFRSYPFTYTEGYELISKAAGSGNKKELFLNCLTTQVLPSQLAAQAAQKSRENA